MRCKQCKIKIEKGQEIIDNISIFCCKSHKNEYNREKINKVKEKVKVKKEKIKKKKAESVSVLKKKLDKVFSEYIRKRDCLETTGTLTHGICITCGERKEYHQFDAGHFVSRAKTSTRHNDMNVNLQCKICNCWGGGRQYEHGVAIDKKYGEGTAMRLIEYGKEIKKMSSGDYLDLILHYVTELANIDKSV